MGVKLVAQGIPEGQGDGLETINPHLLLEETSLVLFILSVHIVQTHKGPTLDRAQLHF
jgi:hypothetical protein